MPFTYNLPVPEIPPEALDDSGRLRLLRFLMDEGRGWKRELQSRSWRALRR
jgi:hypothetical protein